MEVFSDYRKVINPILEGDLTLEILTFKVGTAAGSTLLLKKEIFNEIGYFDEKFQRHQDWEFLIRFFQKYKLMVVPEPLVNIYRGGDYNKKHNPELLEANKKLLLSKYEKLLIKTYGQNEYKLIQHYQWFSMCLVFIENLKIKKAIEYYKKSNELNNLSISKKLGIVIKLIKQLRIKIFKV